MDNFAPARKARVEKYRERSQEAAERVSRGESWDDIASEYGVADEKSFRRRVKRDVGEIKRRSEVLDVIEELDAVVDEFSTELAGKLSEIRSRYE